MDIAKEKRAIEYLNAFQPETEPYFLCYSGGKDSDVILTLADLAGINYEAHHSLTTVDAPETVQYVKSKSNVIIDYPNKSMWQLIVEHHTPPTRIMRYCCEQLKENGGKYKKKITGVRWDESFNRKNNHGLVTVIGKPKTIRKEAENSGINFQLTSKGGLVLNTDNDQSRRFVEMCYRTTNTLVNPILDWSDKDVLDFLSYYGIEINPLYEAKIIGNTYVCTGNKRIGCICCPLSGSQSMKNDLIRYPKYRDNYLRAFKRMLEVREECGMFTNLSWKDPYSVLMWWVGDNPLQTFLETPEYLKGALSFD